MNSMLKVGIIGCGKIAQIRHLPEYQANEKVEIVGLYDINESRAYTLADTYHTKVFETYQSMLEDSQIDAVSVCSSNQSHAEISIAALRAGKHVLCEKPMATKLKDCEAMVEAAKANRKFLMIGQNQRLTAAHQKARELIASGEIGKVLTFRTTFGHGGPETWAIEPGRNTWFFSKEIAAMGTLADLGIHKTDLIQYLLNQTIIETMAYMNSLDKTYENGNLIEVDDNAICIYRLDGGAVGTMTASWTYYAHEDNSTVIYGTQGELRLYDDPAHSVVLHQAGKEPVYFNVDKIQTNENQTKSGVIDLFVDCLEKENYEPLSGESVLKAMRAVFGSIQSSETRRCVPVNQ